MGEEYILILGGPVSYNQPGNLLLERLKTAADYMREHPQSTAVVSGGLTNKACTLSEAEIMKNSLLRLGIPEDRIILEDKAMTTVQNFRYAKEMIPEDSTVFFVTNRFHMWRSKNTMKKEGLSYIPLAAPDGEHSLSFRIREAFLRPLALIGLIR